VCTRTRLSSRAVSQISSYIVFHVIIYLFSYCDDDADRVRTAKPHRLYNNVYLTHHVDIDASYTYTSRRTTCTRRNRVCVCTSCYWFYRPNTYMWYAGRYYADTAAHFTPLFHDTAYGGRYLYIIKKKKNIFHFSRSTPEGVWSLALNCLRLYRLMSSSPINVRVQYTCR